MGKIQSSVMDITLKLEASFNNRGPLHQLALSIVLVLQCPFCLFFFFSSREISQIHIPNLPNCISVLAIE